MAPTEDRPSATTEASAGTPALAPPWDVHPYRAAWQTRDLDVLTRALSPDVVLHSPMFTAPFIGLDVAVELYSVLFEGLGNLEFTDEFSADGSSVLYWRADYRGRKIEGTDRLRIDQDGRICDVTVFIRPLDGIAVFASAIGPALAAKQSSIRRLLVQIVNYPLRAFLATADVVGTWLVIRQGSKGSDG
jgi:SnoaL-like domain